MMAGLNSYLEQLNPKLPTLQADFAQAATVADIYADAAPDLTRVFDNAPALSATIIDQEGNLNATLLAATGLGNNAYETPAPAAEDYIAAIQRLRAPTKLLGEYSPQFGCLLESLVTAADKFGPIIGGTRPGLFVSSNFLPGVPAYTYPESLPIVNATGGQLPRTARHSEQAIRRVLVPRAVPGDRQRLCALPTQHRSAVRRAFDVAVPVQRRLCRTG